MPPWLPPALCWNPNWEAFLAELYECFERDFKQGKRPMYGGKPIVFDKTMENGKENGFWHIISQTDRHTNDRLPEPRRCERITWVRPIIEHADDITVSVFTDGGKTLMWLEEENYMVVLVEKPKWVVLVSSYCTDRRHTREKLAKKRATFQNGGA
jgi:hypothetical protein